MIKTPKLPDHLAAILKRETRGEPVRWYGRPKPSTAFWTTLPVWLMAVPWTAFSTAMLVGLVASLLVGKPSKAPPGTIDAYLPVMGWIGVLFIAPFVLIGLGMLLSPFWVRRKAHGTVYAVTDRRVLTIVAGRKTIISSIDIADVRATTRKERRNGYGDLDLIVGLGRDGDGDTVEKKMALSAIPDVAQVAHLIEEARKAARERRA